MGVSIEQFLERLGELEPARTFRAWELLTEERVPTVPVAYVVPAPAAELDALEVRRQLLSTLPRSSVPAHVAVLPEVPRDAQGKRDRAALARLVDGQVSAPATAAATAPVDSLDRLVRAVWSAHLPGTAATDDLDFFRSGGDSLTAIRVVSALNEALGSSIALVTLFRFPRTDLFAARLRTEPSATGLATEVLLARAAEADPLTGED
ncbi:MAG: phosphopantetheine-binding protein [Aeromicrobium erythreum]